MSVRSYLQSRNFNLDSVVDFQTLPITDLDGVVVSTTNFSTPIGGNGHKYEYDSTEAKANHDGYSIISPTVPWDGTLANLPDFQAAVGETDGAGTGCWILVDTVREVSGRVRFEGPEIQENILTDAQKGVPNGVPSLDGSGLIPPSQIPPSNTISADITYDIGSGGDYATLTEAFEDLQYKTPEYGVQVTLRILAGETISESFEFDGVDLGWITVVGVDTTTTISASSFVSYLYDLDGLDTRYAFIHITNGAVSPVWQQPLVCDASSAGGNATIFLVSSGGLLLLEGTGSAGANFDGNSKVTHILYMSRGEAHISSGFATYSGLFKGFTTQSCYLEHCSRFFARRLRSEVVNGVAASAIISASTGSYAYVEESDAIVSGTGTYSYGIEVDRSSKVDVGNGDYSGAGTTSYRVRWGGTINLTNVLGTAAGTVSQTVNTLTGSGIIFS